MRFPALAILNEYSMGDAVLTEPIARNLTVASGSYVITNYPEVFLGHPAIHGIRTANEMSGDYRIIDISESAKGIEGSGKDARYVSNKYERMCKQAGYTRELGAPQLYLLPTEWARAQEMRSLLPGRVSIGIILPPPQLAENWNFIYKFIGSMSEKGYNVFLFSDQLTPVKRHRLPGVVYHVNGKSTREIMTYLAMMDVVVGGDHDYMQLASSLGVPTVVSCSDVFSRQYNIYPNATVISSDTYGTGFIVQKSSLGTFSKAVRGSLGNERRNPIVDLDALELMTPRNDAYIRIRGLGDILMSLPAIATAKKMDGNRIHRRTYITSHAGKALLDCTDLFDEVIAVDYDHQVTGRPLPPDGIDYARYDSVVNLINAIDYVSESGSTPRTELFAKAIGIAPVDYSSHGWSMTVPDGWQREGRKILASNGVDFVDKTLLFQVGTKGRARAYPKTRVEEFCGIAAKHGWRVILASDQPEGKYPKTAINLTGKLSMEQYIGLAAAVDMRVSPDSALVHIAGAMGKPCVALFGAVDPKLRIAHYKSMYTITGKGACVPCNDWQKACCDHQKRVPTCMWGIKAQEVFDAVREAHRIHRKDNLVEPE